MKILVDTNVVLDVLFNRADFVRDSETIYKLCETGKLDGYISALTIPNIVYIMRKELDGKKTKELLANLLLIFKIADLKSDDIKKAIEFDFGDYEDALQSVCATRIKADYIVTRNIKDFTKSKIPAIKPSELIERI